MSGEYTYYSDGFFGFGPPGTFRPYTLMHWIPILLCIGLLILVGFQKERLRNWKHETRLRFILSFLMFTMEYGYFVRLLYSGDSSGKYLMMARLPFQVCDLGLIVCMFMVPSKNRTLFGINFFVTLFGATLASIIPQTVLTEAGPAHYRYYQYWGEHLIPIFSTVYMMMVHGFRPRYRDIWFAVGALALFAIPAYFLNEAFPGANYMFLRQDIPGFPENQLLRVALYAVLIIAVFHLIFGLWTLALRIFRKKPAPEVLTEGGNAPS